MPNGKQAPYRKYDTDDGWHVVVRVEADDDPDLSWLGEYWGSRQSHSKRSTPPYPYYDRAIGRVVMSDDDLEGLSDEEVVEIERFDNRNFRYIVPGNWDPQYPQHFEQDAKRLEKYGDDWSCVGVVAEVSRKGVVLGGSSVWGIESDSDEEHFDETAKEMVIEAMLEAEKKLAELKED